MLSSPTLDERSAAVSNLRLNPYIAGKSLSGDHGFFGRQDIFELVQTELARSALVLYGQRRIGKTSILKQLQRRLRAPYIAVYFDLMDRAEQPMGQLLTDLAQLMAQGAGLPEPTSPMDDAGMEFHQRFLPSLYQALGTERAMVLLLDEFDVLDRTAEQQLPQSAAARAFFPYLRRLIESERRLHFLVVIGRKTEELSSDFKATFKASKFKRVSVLSAEEARQLVTLAERQGSLRFEPGVVEQLLALTTGHPYLTQLVCQQVWDATHSGSEEAAPLVTPQLLSKVVPRVLEAGQNVFEWIWDGLPPAERVVLAAIAEATEQQPTVTEEQVLDMLQRHGVRVLSGELDLAPRKLVDWELLRVVDGGYGCHVELIRRWVVTQKPLLRVKDEVYRLNPLAERLFLSARDFYALNQPVKTQDHLVEVLQINPGHLPARLLLARLLLERGQHAQAVQELERAWAHDEAAARMPLVGALLATAEAQERRGESQSAIQSYERALSLSPSERIASEGLLRLRQNLVREPGARQQPTGRTEVPVGDQPTELLAILDPSTRPKHKTARLVVTVALALLLMGAGGAAVLWINRLPPVDAEAEAGRLLTGAQGDLQKRRWVDASSKANRVIGNPAVSAGTRRNAIALLNRAETESRVESVYQRFLSSGLNYDQALLLYNEIPEDSVYHSGAREIYDKIFPLYVEQHLKAAEEARAAGKCQEFHKQVKTVLNLDPKQLKALQAEDRPCADASVALDAGTKLALVASDHVPVIRPKNASAAHTSITPEDRALSEAQTRFVNGDYAGAIDLAKSVAQANPVRAWRIIGCAACNLKDVKLANEAFERLDASGRTYLSYCCQRVGISRPYSGFKLAEAVSPEAPNDLGSTPKVDGN